MAKEIKFHEFLTPQGRELFQPTEKVAVENSTKPVENKGVDRGLCPGDRVLTPSGCKGSILPPPWFMPFHHLVQLDEGRTIWLLRAVLKLDVAEVNPIKRRRAAA